MNKYLTLLKLSWQNGLVYRTSLILWRFRNFLSTLMSLTIWSVVFNSSSSVFGYSRDGMISYVFLIAFLQSMILATSHNGLAQRIYSGAISMHLLKPVNIYLYLAVEEIADKVKNIFFLFVETGILFILFTPIFVTPNIQTILLFLVWSFGGLILNFFITLLFGSLGFWSPQTWGPRFLFFMLVELTAGKLFPLDVLPQATQQVVYLTPLPYLSFFQIQLFLQRIPQNEIPVHSALLLFWILALGLITKIIWQRGIKSYEAVGQ